MISFSFYELFKPSSRTAGIVGFKTYKICQTNANEFQCVISLFRTHTHTHVEINGIICFVADDMTMKFVALFFVKRTFFVEQRWELLMIKWAYQSHFASTTLIELIAFSNRWLLRVVQMHQLQNRCKFYGFSTFHSLMCQSDRNVNISICVDSLKFLFVFSFFCAHASCVVAMTRRT